MNMVSGEAQDRRELLVYLTERIETLWLEPRNRPDLPLVQDQNNNNNNNNPYCYCRVPHVPNAWFHPSLIHFQAQTLPKPSLFEYFNHIVQFCEISGEALVRAIFLLAYFRYCYRQIFPITPYTVHRLLVTVLLCAAKFGEDYPWSNAHFARNAMITTQELNRLEAEFLSLIQFQLFVPNQKLEEFLYQLFLTKPTTKLFRIPFDIALQLVTVKSFQEICATHFPSIEKALFRRIRHVQQTTKQTKQTKQIDHTQPLLQRHATDDATTLNDLLN